MFVKFGLSPNSKSRFEASVVSAGKPFVSCAVTNNKGEAELPMVSPSWAQKTVKFVAIPELVKARRGPPSALLVARSGTFIYFNKHVNV